MTLDADLTPNIVQEFDDTELLPGGATRQVTRIRFMLGDRLGPYELKVARDTPRHAIEQLLNAKRDERAGLVRKV